jgi:hypothetical protein
MTKEEYLQWCQKKSDEKFIENTRKLESSRILYKERLESLWPVSLDPREDAFKELEKIADEFKSVKWI